MSSSNIAISQLPLTRLKKSRSLIGKNAGSRARRDGTALLHGWVFIYSLQDFWLFWLCSKGGFLFILFKTFDFWRKISCSRPLLPTCQHWLGEQRVWRCDIIITSIVIIKIIIVSVTAIVMIIIYKIIKIIIFKVLVPLCGKAGCLLYLYKAGHTVVGENFFGLAGWWWWSRI